MMAYKLFGTSAPKKGIGIIKEGVVAVGFQKGFPGMERLL